MSELLAEEHRPVPDGRRPLQIEAPRQTLSAQLLEGPERTCYVAWSLTNPPTSCRLRITPGEHFVLWTEHDVEGKPTGRTEAYCAPCAVAEWAHAGVGEVTL